MRELIPYSYISIFMFAWTFAFIFKFKLKMPTRAIVVSLFAFFFHLNLQHLFIEKRDLVLAGDFPVILSIGAILTALLGVFISSVFRNFLNVLPPYFGSKSSSAIAVDTRISIISAAWLLTITCTCFLASYMAVYPDVITDGFYTSWVGDVLFFSVVGLAVAMVGIYMPEGEKFDRRVAILFSGYQSNAIVPLKEKVKELGFIVCNSHRHLEVVDWSDEFYAYKVNVTTEYILVNLFGDEAAVGKIKFGVKPDKFEGSKLPPVLGKVLSINEIGKGPRLDSQVEITPDGFSKEETFTVGGDKKLDGGDTKIHVRFRYWLWVEAFRPWSHKAVKFIEEGNTSVTNLIEGENRVVLIEDMITDELDPIRVRFDREKQLKKYKDLNQGQAIKVLKMLPPEIDIEAISSGEEE